MKQHILTAWTHFKAWWIYTPTPFSFSIAWWNTRAASLATLLVCLVVVGFHPFTNLIHIDSGGVHQWSSITHEMCTTWLSPLLGVVFAWCISAWGIHVFLSVSREDQEKRRLFLIEKGDDALARATFRRQSQVWHLYLLAGSGIAMSCFFMWFGLLSPQGERFVDAVYFILMMGLFLSVVSVTMVLCVGALMYLVGGSEKIMGKTTITRFNALPHVVKVAARVRANTLGISPDDTSFMKAAIAGYEADRVRAHAQATILLDATNTATGEPSKRRL